MKSRALSIVLGGLVLFQAGLLFGQLHSARAEPPPPPPETGEGIAFDDGAFFDPPRLYCRPFEVPLDGARAAMETNDRTTPMGRWIADEEASYLLHTIDFEVGQKPTGYPVGIAYVCLRPR